MKRIQIILIFFLIISFLQLVTAKESKIESDDSEKTTVKRSSKKKITLLVENIAEKFNLNTSQSKTFSFPLKQFNNLSNLST